MKKITVSIEYEENESVELATVLLVSGVELSAQASVGGIFEQKLGQALIKAAERLDKTIAKEG